MERDGSPLKDRILHFYPQGSMAIDATISARWTDGDYDIDVIAQLDLPPGTLLSRVGLGGGCAGGIPGEGRSSDPLRHHLLREHAPRCHSVDPARLHPGPAEQHFPRQEGGAGLVALHRADERLRFASWYEGRTPYEQQFAEAYNERLYRTASRVVKADAEVDEVPEQCH